MGEAKLRADEIEKLKAAAASQQQMIAHSQALLTKEAVFANSFALGDANDNIRISFMESVGPVQQVRSAVAVPLAISVGVADGILHVAEMMAKARGLTLDDLRKQLNAGTVKNVNDGDMTDQPWPGEDAPLPGEAAKKPETIN